MSEMSQLHRQRNEALAAALESGEYEQGVSYLHRMVTDENGEHHTWCCLGVAADLACKAGVQLDRKLRTLTDGHVRVEEFGHDAAFPVTAVVKYYGWDSYNPQLVMEDGEEQTAAFFNDTMRNGRHAYDLRTIGAAFRRTFAEDTEE